MTIKIIGPDFDGYAMDVDGERLLECLGEQELKNLTIGEITDLYNAIYS